MFISKQKKEENIAEYVLYMWQIEDLIRSCNFDIGRIEDAVINSFSGNLESKEEVKRWYTGLIVSMSMENVKERGHLNYLNATVSEMNYLRTSLINVFQDPEYVSLYTGAVENINELRKRSNGSAKTDIEACLNGLYGILILKLQGKEISEGTIAAIKTISRLMAFLSTKFKDMKEGKLELPKMRSN